MLVDPSNIRGSDLYQHMIRLIGPRPIAWISTQSSAGILNLAPYSFFTGVTSKPPSLVFSSVRKADGSLKDTLTNILDTQEFVVNVVPFKLAESMVATSQEFATEIDEFEACSIATASSHKVRVPRVADSPAAIECRLLQVVDVGSGPGAASLVIGEIVAISIDDSVLDENRWPDPAKLDLIGRMGGNTYARTTDRFDLVRPQ